MATNKLPAGFAVGDTLQGRYVLKKVMNPNTGEAAIFVCEYDDFPFLVKVYFPGKEPSDDRIETEKTISSPNIVKKSDRFEWNECHCEIMPFFNKADLISSGKAINDKRLFETIIPNVNEALNAVHSAGLTHNNVRPTNIYYSPFRPDQVLLGDLGVSLENTEGFEKNIAFAFLPPESAKGVYGKEADYWSLGITLVMLVTGRGVFDGLNRKQMLKKACTGEMFTIPEKASPQLKTIIRGLTVRDPATRWGYDEVKRALAGEDVPVVDNYVYEPPTDTLVFEGTPVKGLENIALAFANDWDNALSYISEPALLEIVDNYAEDKYNDVLACGRMEDMNLALYNLINILNPNLPPIWKGMEISDVEQFSQEMKIAYDKDVYMDALSYGIVSSVAEKYGANSDIVSKIKTVEAAAENGENPEVLAYKLSYYVAGEYIYNFRDISCRSVDDLVSYIRANINDLEAICEEFINDTEFFAWLDVLGFGEQIEQWRRNL